VQPVPEGHATRIFIDADGCPVKQETYRVAQRHGIRVVQVSNKWMRAPLGDGVEQVVVEGQFDAADDWIVEHVAENDIVVSDDIPLASRCLPKGARVLNSRGRVFTEDSIGGAMAARELSAHLRELGEMTGGPSAIAPRDRSRFLQKLDELVRTAGRTS
jgi:uncharacterized protein YaiI (UPF0178 family)